jgi:orotidine-5'-phosphate decarboxylase
MPDSVKSRLIAALDTSSLDEARELVGRLAPFVGAFKVGHALTLGHGLGVLSALKAEGAERIFLDLKFHDIPHATALAVGEAARAGAWMTTIHASGGRAMVQAAAAVKGGVSLMGVSALTSLSAEELRDEAGVERSPEEHLMHQAAWGLEAGLDGMICSVLECAALRARHPEAILVTPGIRAAGADTGDQTRVATGGAALAAGASYLVIGRALTGAADPRQALADLELPVD